LPCDPLRFSPCPEDLLRQQHLSPHHPHSTLIRVLYFLFPFLLHGGFRARCVCGLLPSHVLPVHRGAGASSTIMDRSGGRSVGRAVGRSVGRSGGRASGSRARPPASVHSSSLFLAVHYYSSC